MTIILFYNKEKLKMKKQNKNPIINNLVAKHCHQFNRHKVEEDKTSYKRKTKHAHKKYVEYFLMFSPV